MLKVMLKLFSFFMKTVGFRTMFVSQEIEFRTMFVSQETIYKMTLILSLKLWRDCELCTWIGNEFHNLGAVYEYDLSNKEERDIGTANAPLTDDLSARLLVSDTCFSKSVI